MVGLAGGGRSAVGVDRLGPEAEAREDVRRHVLGVRHRGRGPGIAASGDQPTARQGRIVVAVDDVVRGAGVLRLLREDPFEDRARLELVGVGLVGGRCGRVERQRVEDGGFPIVGIAAGQPLHGLLVGGRPRAVIERVGVAIVRRDGRDVLLLPRGRDQPARLLDRVGAPVQHRRARRLPERMVDAHRDAPVAHRARGVRGRDRGEGLLRLLVPERVQQRDRALEVGPNRGRAGDGEANGPELFSVVGERHRKRGEQERGERDEQQATLHGMASSSALDSTEAASRTRDRGRLLFAQHGRRPRGGQDRKMDLLDSRAAGRDSATLPTAATVTRD